MTHFSDINDGDIQSKIQLNKSDTVAESIKKAPLVSFKNDF